MPQDEQTRHLLETTFRLDARLSQACLSAEQTALLVRYGTWMEALATSRLWPTTKAQRHFIDVAAGVASPQTPFEEAWAIYRTEAAFLDAQGLEERLGEHPDVTAVIVRTAYENAARLGHAVARSWCEGGEVEYRCAERLHVSLGRNRPVTLDTVIAAYKAAAALGHAKAKAWLESTLPERTQAPSDNLGQGWAYSEEPQWHQAGGGHRGGRCSTLDEIERNREPNEALGRR